MAIHPDKFSTAEKQQQELSTSVSAYVNTAYYTLRNDLERALYMLRLQGISALEEDSRADDFEFLEEILELQEQV